MPMGFRPCQHRKEATFITTLVRIRTVERLWRGLFSDPSQWWDHRPDKAEKGNERYPDFKHKKTQESLWLDSKFNPPWVEAEVAALAPGTVQWNSFSWNSRLARYVKARKYKEALEFFHQQQQQSMAPDRFTFIPVLNACANLRDLEEGSRIHAQIMQRCCESDLYVGNSLVDMYAKCGSIEDAWKVFRRMPIRDVVSWNAIILGYVKCGQGQKALELSHQMQTEGVAPVNITFVALVNACASLQALGEGRRIHAQIIQFGCDADVYVGNSLVDMYAKCGSIDESWGVFSKMPIRSVVSWNAMILGHVKCGQGQKAIELFQQMQMEGVKPVSVTFVGVVNACASLRALEEGRRVHALIVQSGCESDVYVDSSLVDMYAKCGSTEDAFEVFNKMPKRNVVTWSAMISGLVKHGHGLKALELFQSMQEEGVKADPITYVGALNACASTGALKEGREIHKQIIQRGFESHLFVSSSLVDMYVKCAKIGDASRVFEKLPACNVVTWNSMIQGYAKCGQGQQALELYQRMQRKGVEPDHITFVGLVNACASIGALEEGRGVHKRIVQSGNDSDIFIGNSLVHMYAKCGSIDEAWTVFTEMPVRDVVSWNAMIQGLVKCADGRKALDIYSKMQNDGLEPDPVTFVGLLSACASVASLEEGRHIHAQIIKSGCESHILVANSLVDMYAKCGSVEDALRVFKNMPSRDVVAWSAIIQGFVKSGNGQKALKLSKQMQEEGLKPDPVNFVAFLNACASVAALAEGKRFHEQIIQRGLESDIFVGGSLIDMYAKCGSMEDAVRVFKKMPTLDIVCWNAMLGGYAIQGLAEEALSHFEWMCREGVEVDRVTFISLLTACSHVGQVDEGMHHFKCMETVNKISPSEEHYACMVDLLSRAGRLDEAEDLIKTMSCEPDVALWTALLGACRVHGNLEMGERIGKDILKLDPGNSAGYVLLSNIYAAAGKWESSENLQRQRHAMGAKKQLGCTWTEVNNEVHSFIEDDQDHPEITRIHTELQRLSQLMKELGYVRDTQCVDPDVEVEKFSRCHHSEKLAIAFGLMNTPPCTTIRILNNMPMCGDCHTAIKFITNIVGREVIARDINRVHHFQDGVCSCGDYW